ncbi:DUF6461 domain-containing protein [Streptomyces sp. PTM05]|uniref:DUF6461 domain-containing protein n=1 Tax=Streptantibioticus parmotrematis TaxID=2873249 RepID=A0ABS7QLV6_9ACTN|nr:DUF6461 domain-containing protein [Streptantibioticus parmotrematis]MBY8884158.1 DUF6461 domain-containing protein [Streptantibioticus parmotrematis]
MTATPWHWALTDDYPAFCLTFARGLDPHALLRRYGAHSGDPRVLTEQESIAEPPADASLLRAGTVDGWAFCFETRGVQGWTAHVLTEVSRDTESFTVMRAGALHAVSHWQNGQKREAFEPGTPYSFDPNHSHLLWNAVRARLEQPRPVPSFLAALDAVSEHIGGSLTESAIEGPLLTVVLPEPASVLPEATAGHEGLGRCLGTLAPPPPSRDPESR